MFWLILKLIGFIALTYLFAVGITIQEQRKTEEAEEEVEAYKSGMRELHDLHMADRNKLVATIKELRAEVYVLKNGVNK